MSTVSTKSRASNKKRGQTNEPRDGKGKDLPEPAPAEGISTRAWLTAAGSILAIGAFLRLYDLPLVPLHHDEGVNGNFLVRLVREGVYQYDPANYHGPTLYYFAAIFPWTIRFLLGANAQNSYGLTTMNIRLVTALFGVGTICLVLLLRKQLGTIGVLSAAALLAISPGAVYLSRYFIHESLFVFFTLGIVVAGLYFCEEGHPVYLVLLFASAGLLFATKETWIISAGVLIIALASTLVYRWLWSSLASGKRNEVAGNDGSSTFSEWTQSTIEHFGGPLTLAISVLAAIAVCIAIGVLFYSSFGTHWKGVGDSVKTFEVWTKTGQTAHVHSWWTYVTKWLVYQESPVLFLGAIGFVLILLKPRNAVALFCGLWAFGIIAAYSLVQYKTPWLLLNFIVPLALISGYGFEWLYQNVGKDLRLLATIGVLVLSVSGYQMIDLNFRNYDNDNEYYVYVYAHSRRDLIKLVDDVNRIAQHSGKPADTGITIVSPEYWPLPWYFRDYQRVGYYGRMSASAEPVVIASETQRSEADAAFGSRYRLVQSGLNPRGSFALRPGVDLLLYVRSDVPAP